MTLLFWGRIRAYKLLNKITKVEMRWKIIMLIDIEMSSGTRVCTPPPTIFSSALPLPTSPFCSWVNFLHFFYKPIVTCWSSVASIFYASYVVFNYLWEKKLFVELTNNVFGNSIGWHWQGRTFCPCSLKRAHFDQSQVEKKMHNLPKNIQNSNS